jgi:DNA-binding NtrC family response regulator
LKTEAAEVLTEKNPENIRSILYKNHFDLILLDMNFNSVINTGNEGLYWLRKIREWDAAASVIMITAYGDIDLAVRSLKEGAVDFVVKPWHNEKLTTTIRETLQKKDGSAPAKTVETTAGKGQTPFIGHSPPMKDIMSKVEIAPTDANILILGRAVRGKTLWHE